MLNQLIQAFSPKNAQITVSISFDNNYLDYGKILLNSIQENSPNVKVVILAINTPESGLQKFSGNDNIRIIHEYKEFAHPYEQRLYVTTRRIFLINDLRHDPSVENLLQLDADAIVKRNLNHFGIILAKSLIKETSASLPDLK